DDFHPISMLPPQLWAPHAALEKSTGIFGTTFRRFQAKKPYFYSIFSSGGASRKAFCPLF
ncbi:hypothetical protein, partial [Desulfovibrio sp. X2]|uniref:hypothetical protein n=1 Tax=Desulfovibrio sp. X2 TaxID=941449 RepID=UPI001F1B2262